MESFNLITHDETLVHLILKTNQKILAQWAMDCVERQRHLLKESYTEEHAIVDHAFSTLKMWMNDEMTMWEARKYCWTILDAARAIESKDKVACQMLRATSHTLATCHVITHAEGSAMYVISALQHHYHQHEDQIEVMTLEREWQINHLLEMI